ncbi:biotin--[acetyl-CoA-carboxylase] ligase [bacterium]|nr:biotin--[acetyl-CoA-carboxylase] ligase [bacterium]MBU4561245.1 biotin--[acetyl-CoA-carboxylase] ligase [bacterium]MCG2675648.1 biotin--[acetyl-CoA-carboxylase] ligase [bacterium]
MRERILNLLYQRKKEYVSGEELSQKVGISRTAIWKHIQALKGAGYKINSQKRLGYSLVSVPDLLLPYEIKRDLKTKILGKRIYYFKEIGSTNDCAIELARPPAGEAGKGAREGTIVIAEVQTKGKGRLGREWSSPFGGLWLSIILRPKILPTQAPRMTVIAALGVAKTIRELYSLDAFIKWPNDILIRSQLGTIRANGRMRKKGSRVFKKVCGILTEMEAEQDTVNYVVIGIGANLNIDVKKFPIEFRKDATSLEKELGRKIDRVEFTKRMLEEIENFYLLFKKRGFAPILKEWKEISATLGKGVKAVSGRRIIEGKAIDIDSDGTLIIKTKAGKKERILAGDVTLL